MNYWEKYGEENLTDSQIEEQQERINQQETLEKYKKCIERIKELVQDDELDVESLKKEMKKELEDF